jgi:hypothetical protein
MNDSYDTPLELKVKDLELQLSGIRAELSRYLVMSPRETIIGGIRNLVQASILHQHVTGNVTVLWGERYEDKGESGRPG